MRFKILRSIGIFALLAHALIGSAQESKRAWTTPSANSPVLIEIFMNHQVMEADSVNRIRGVLKSSLESPVKSTPRLLQAFVQR